jgi:hypothetical protein
MIILILPIDYQVILGLEGFFDGYRPLLEEVILVLPELHQLSLYNIYKVINLQQLSRRLLVLVLHYDFFVLIVGLRAISCNNREGFILLSASSSSSSSSAVTGTVKLLLNSPHVGAGAAPVLANNPVLA